MRTAVYASSRKVLVDADVVLAQKVALEAIANNLPHTDLSMRDSKSNVELRQQLNARSLSRLIATEIPFNTRPSLEGAHL